MRFYGLLLNQVVKKILLVNMFTEVDLGIFHVFYPGTRHIAAPSVFYTPNKEIWPRWFEKTCQHFTNCIARLNALE